jgi:hypothetical protein
VLGDGGLRIWKNRPNLPAGYSLSQIDKHEEYVKWQQSILENITGTTLHHYPPSVKDGVNRQGYFKLATKGHPFFQTLRDRWYHTGRKTISLHDLSLMDWQMMAIWYMDDGYILKSDNKYHDGHVYLCTDNFTEAEVVMLQKIIYSSLGVAMDIRQRGRKKDGTRIYRLTAKNAQARKFLDGVTPFIFESFKYKVRTGNPFIEGDDIVCSAQECAEAARNEQSRHNDE